MLEQDGRTLGTGKETHQILRKESPPAVQAIEPGSGLERDLALHIAHYLGDGLRTAP